MQKSVMAALVAAAAVLVAGDRPVVRAQGIGTWSVVAPTSMPHGGHGAAVTADGRIVVIDDQGVEIYDVEANTWTTGTPMLSPRFNLGGVATGGDGRIYAIGGGDANGVLATAEAYEVASGTWTVVTDMPTARQSAGVVAGADGRVYVIGGSDLTQAFTTVEAYDPATTAWTTLAPMPTPRSELSAALGLDGRIYAIGGRDPSLSTILSVVEAYDPATNAWTTLAPLPAAVRASAAATAPNGWVVASGGFRAGATDADTTAVALNPATNTWTHLPPMATPRFGHAAVAGRDGRIYAIAGTPTPGSNQTTAVEAFTFVSQTLRLYLHGPETLPTAGGFTMSPTPPSTTPAPLALLDTTRWFSHVLFAGMFGADARVRFVKPCSLGLTLAATYTVAATDASGGAARVLGQASRPLGLCLASETIVIPMAPSSRLANERLAFAISTAVGTNVTLAPGIGMYLEATDFTGVP